MVEFCVDVDPHTLNKVEILRLNFGKNQNRLSNVQYYAVILTSHKLQLLKSQDYHVYLDF